MNEDHRKATILKARLSGHTWREAGALVGVSEDTARRIADDRYKVREIERNRDRRRRRMGNASKWMVRAEAKPDDDELAARLAEIPPDTRDLTGRLAGDPLPGRSALDRKRMGLPV